MFNKLGNYLVRSKVFVNNILNYSKKFKFNITVDKKELKKKLSILEYQVTQEKGTEPPFNNEYWDNKEKGIYSCVVCGNDLFKSEHKFESGTGWPSFYDVDKKDIEIESDRSYGMIRDEVLCKNCGSHLGHVFDDGPKPTGKRYCINSASLLFKKI